MTSIEQVNNITNSQQKFFTTKDIRALFNITAERTLEDSIKRLIDANILTQLEKGKYHVSNTEVSSFEIAQFIYSPSYISFETALNYHGILSQFPVEITSVTTKKGTTKTVSNTTYSYAKINAALFIGYYKINSFLLAYPEKALFDQFYMISKSLKSEEYLNEMDYARIDKMKVIEYVNLTSNNYRKSLSNLISKYL